MTTATVVAVQTAALTFPNGRMFDPSLAGAVTLTLNTPPPNTFALVGRGVPPWGVLTFREDYGTRQSYTDPAQTPL
jgi:hypothetical protein